MHNVRASLLISCSVISGACVFDSVAGSGKIMTEPRTVSGFSAVSLSGSGQVIIEQTGMESLTVTTDDNLLPYIKTDVKGNTLELGLKDSMTYLRPTHDIVFRLTVRKLEGLDISGSGKADAKGLDPDHVKIKVSGSGEVSAQGTANDLDLSISGSGGYRGEDMRSKRATIDISGSGGAVIAASETLKAHVSGSGSIEYIGDPQVTQHVSGSGSVHRR
jgi:Putative auto-transporter adhesin, head GIN domain